MANAALAFKRYADTLRGVMQRTTGQRYHGLFIDNNQGRFSFDVEPLVAQFSIVDNDADLGYAKATDQSNATIFNTWTKISRKSSSGDADPFSDNAIPEEREAFSYDAETDTISNPLNTSSLVGFISPDRFSDYVLDVQLTSTSTDENDPIGLCIGYATDSDGTTHTLTVMRNLYDRNGGNGDQPVKVQVDLLTAGQVDITGTGAGLTWVGGFDGEGPSPTADDFEGVSPWKADPWGNNPNGIRLRITRTGDDFLIETTEYNGTEFISAANLAFSLNDHSSLSRFKGASRYGFVSLSQELANWKAFQRPIKASEVFDLRTNTRHYYSNGEWLSEVVPVGDYIKPGRLYFNPTSRKIFHCDLLGTVRQLLSASS